MYAGGKQLQEWHVIKVILAAIQLAALVIYFSAQKC